MVSNELRPLRVLVASTVASDLSITEKVVARLAARDHVTVQLIFDHDSRHAIHGTPRIPNAQFNDQAPCHAFKNILLIRGKAVELCGWADLLVIVSLDADTLARMLNGMTTNLLLEIVRSWDVHKKILMVPGLSTLMWENPMTKKQLSKIRRKWNWVRVLQPLLWTFDSAGNKKESWEGMEELMETIQNQVDLMTIGHDIDIISGVAAATKPDTVGDSRLPPELWTMIMDYTEDWELSKALNIYTTLPTPPEWQQHVSREGPRTFMEKLEWAILTGPLREVKGLIIDNHGFTRLSRLSVRLIMRFGMVPLLHYLEANHKDLFRTSFDSTFIPHKASALFGRTELLEYWRTSPSFLTKEYKEDAMDGASRAGFVHVLDWWYKSGLELKYSEAALEQASSKGHIDVLEWWKNASLHENDFRRSSSPDRSRDKDAPIRPPLRLKPGKSISYAAQSGSLPTLRWWATSSIPFPHEDTVPKLASMHNYIHLLRFWQSLRGEKMIFDNQVLVVATKMGHRGVLEWWKNSGLRVEYKTCDIEEALEDGVGGVRGQEVRRWWARNGLNLGLGTTEWMKSRVLGA